MPAVCESLYCTYDTLIRKGRTRQTALTDLKRKLMLPQVPGLPMPRVKKTKNKNKKNKSPPNTQNDFRMTDVT